MPASARYAGNGSLCCASVPCVCVGEESSWDGFVVDGVLHPACCTPRPRPRVISGLCERAPALRVPASEGVREDFECASPPAAGFDPTLRSGIAGRVSSLWKAALEGSGVLVTRQSRLGGPYRPGDVWLTDHDVRGASWLFGEAERRPTLISRLFGEAERRPTLISRLFGEAERRPTFKPPFSRPS